jgi:hypothetical protein
MRQPDVISPGMRGFLLTCFRNQESRCISEFYDLFNKVIHIYSGKTSYLFNAKTFGDHDHSSETEENVELDFEKAISNELIEMKNKKKTIEAIKNDVKGVIFFKTPSNLNIFEAFNILVKAVTDKNWKPK